MTATKTKAATAARPAANSRTSRADAVASVPFWQRTGQRISKRFGKPYRWVVDNCLILIIIAINGAGSFNHMIELARAKGGQTGAGVYFAAGIFDLFVFAMRIESQRDKRRGTITKKWTMSAPVFLQMVGLGFSVAANYATIPKHPGFWAVTFGIVQPIVLMLAILMLERRYRLDALAALAAGSAGSAGSATAGIAAGSAPGSAAEYRPSSDASIGAGSAAGIAADGGAGSAAGDSAAPPATGRHAAASKWTPGAWPTGIKIPRPGDGAPPVVSPDGLYALELAAVRKIRIAYPGLNDGRALGIRALRHHTRRGQNWCHKILQDLAAEDRAAAEISTEKAARA